MQKLCAQHPPLYHPARGTEATVVHAQVVNPAGPAQGMAQEGVLVEAARKKVQERAHQEGEDPSWAGVQETASPQADTVQPGTAARSSMGANRLPDEVSPHSHE